MWPHCLTVSWANRLYQPFQAKGIYKEWDLYGLDYLYYLSNLYDSVGRVVLARMAEFFFLYRGVVRGLELIWRILLCFA